MARQPRVPNKAGRERPSARAPAANGSHSGGINLCARISWFSFSWPEAVRALCCCRASSEEEGAECLERLRRILKYRFGAWEIRMKANVIPIMTVRRRRGLDINVANHPRRK